jgi:hypothetical protein
MNRGDRAVETAADKLETFVKTAQRSGGVKAKVGQALAEDPEFLRKLKPSLIAARAQGETPTQPPRDATATAPSGPQLARPEPPRQKPPAGGGPNPWLVIGAALAAGYLIAKAIDWRGHAHPRL